MKKISKLLAVCCFVVSISAYTQEKLDCEFNFKEALSYVQLSQNFKKDSLKVIKLLKPCLKKGDANAQLLMGRLYAVNGDEKSYKKAFKLFRKSAKKGNAKAMVDLGLMYKYGTGCKLNFNKARKWFKKGAELGNNKGAYSLGYIYLKGFGNIGQNYSKAVKWFEKSEYSMAKYWLGVCYYYGYGVDQNINKANELLETSFETNTENSDTLSDIEESANNISEQLEANSNDVVDLEGITQSSLFGKWTGSLLKYDWSGKYIEQKHPFKIEFKYDSINETSVYLFHINEKILTGNLNKLDEAIYFEDVQIKLSHTSFNERIPSELDYHLLSADLTIKELAGSEFLVGGFDNYIEKWNESGAPLKFVLKKKETFANSDEELSEDVLQALSSQEEKFIKLYPNPFQSDLIVSYTLQEPSFVEVQISDINGTKNSIIEKGKQQNKGKHRYFFDGTILEKGIYVVTVLVNNQRKTRIIVKK